MRALIVLVAVGASGCALIDGLGGDDGSGGGGGECTPSYVSRDLNSATALIVDHVSLLLDLDHSAPQDLIGHLVFSGVDAAFAVPFSGQSSVDFNTEFGGLEASGIWSISLEDGVLGDAGIWNSASILACDTVTCETVGVDVATLTIDDCL